MSSSEDVFSRTSPIDPSLVDTNAGEVPADRPHFAFWPQAPAAHGDAARDLAVAQPGGGRARAIRPRPPRSTSAARRPTPRCAPRPRRIAGWLQAQGVRRGDRVALFMQNCPQYLVAYHGILRADAVVVPVNAMNKAEEFGHYIVDPGTKVVICGAELAAIVASANAALPPSQRVARVLATRYADELPDGLRRRPRAAARDARLAAAPTRRCRPAPCAGPTRWPKATCPARTVNGPDDLALLPYTSGTTGLPKGCMHTHRTLMANVIGGAEWGSGSAESVVLGVVPMFHITGMLYGVISPMFGGATVVDHAALGPRAGRAPDLAPQGLALDLHPDDDHRPVRAAPTTAASTSAACAGCRAAARRCRRRWRSACSTSSACTSAKATA